MLLILPLSLQINQNSSQPSSLAADAAFFTAGFAAGKDFTGLAFALDFAALIAGSMRLTTGAAGFAGAD